MMMKLYKLTILQKCHVPNIKILNAPEFHIVRFENDDVRYYDDEEMNQIEGCSFNRVDFSLTNCN